MVFRFGTCELDLDAYRLVVEGEAVAVEPQVFDVLAYLARNPERVVTKEELLDNVWGDRFVSESALTSRIKSARRAVGDDGRRQAVIRTVHGRGYQFVAPLVSEGGGGPPGSGPDGADDQGPAGGVERADPEVVAGFGRDELLEEVASRVVGGRLVTLVGPAGVGKTHLARRLLASLRPRFPAGAWMVTLAEVRDPDAVADAVLDAIGATRVAGLSPTDSVAAALADRQALLVVDNCEHLLDGVGRLLRDLQISASGTAVLSTSRRRLGLSGERVIEIPVLAPDAAVALFVTRAAEHGVELEPADETVRNLCRRLDHLPLALELAGAHTRVLGLDLLTELLDDRLSVLHRDGGDPHHRTLETAIASSYESLEPEVRATLDRFSVFAGAFTADAATAVAGAGRDLGRAQGVRHVVDLADRSLLVVEPGSGGGPRYRLLESVRLFAADRLTDPAATRLAHLEHYTLDAEARARRLDGPGYREAVDEVVDGWSNYRSALDTAIELGSAAGADTGVGAADLGARLLAATMPYAELTQRLEHGDWARRLLAAGGLAPDHEAVTRSGRSRLAILSDLDEAVAQADASGDPGRDPQRLLTLCWARYMTGELDAGRKRLLEADAVLAGTGGLGELYLLGLACFHEARALVDPRPWVERLLAVTDDAHPLPAAYRRWGRATAALWEGDLGAAIAATDQLVDDGAEHGYELLVLVGRRLRTVALASHDDLPLVAGRLLEAQRRYARRHHWTSAVSDSPMVARLLVEQGRLEPAARLLGAHGPVGPVGGWSSRLSIALRERIEEALGAEQVEAWYAEGRALTPAELSALAISELERTAAPAPGPAPNGAGGGDGGDGG